jgi:hypothetical protein
VALWTAIRRRRDGTFAIKWSAIDRSLLEMVVGEMRELVTSDDPGVTRLYPSAYGNDDDERNAGWDALARGELVDHRLASLDTVEGLLRHDRGSAEELGALMRVVNDARLVLGTRLDVTEDGPPADLSPDERRAYALYEHLAALLVVTIRALDSTLAEG